MKSNLWLIIGGILLLFFAGWRNVFPVFQTSGDTSQKLDTSLSGKAKQVYNAIKDALTKAGYSQSQIENWFFIAKMETANFTSNLVSYNNFLGMKLAKIRPTSASGETPSGFASYLSLKQCADDLVYYLDYFKYPKNFSSLSDQIAFMKEKGYFEESFDYYFAAVKAWMTK